MRFERIETVLGGERRQSSRVLAWVIAYVLPMVSNVVLAAKRPNCPMRTGVPRSGRLLQTSRLLSD